VLGPATNTILLAHDWHLYKLLYMLDAWERQLDFLAGVYLHLEMRHALRTWYYLISGCCVPIHWKPARAAIASLCCMHAIIPLFSLERC
jgi:hypothetical protein